MAIKKVVSYETSDGSVFSSQEAAMDWERDAKLVAAINKLAEIECWDLSPDQIKRLVRFLNINYAVCPRKGDEPARA
mgnify:CR=1 FL=1